MENADIFVSATAPLTFHDFLDRMRHPQAADIVRSIKRLEASTPVVLCFVVPFVCNSVKQSGPVVWIFTARNFLKGWMLVSLIEYSIPAIK